MDEWMSKTFVRDLLCETPHRSLSGILSENKLRRFMSHPGNKDICQQASMMARGGIKQKSGQTQI